MKTIPGENLLWCDPVLAIASTSCRSDRPADHRERYHAVLWGGLSNLPTQIRLPECEPQLLGPRSYLRGQQRDVERRGWADVGPGFCRPPNHRCTLHCLVGDILQESATVSHDPDSPPLHNNPLQASWLLKWLQRPTSRELFFLGYTNRVNDCWLVKLFVKEFNQIWQNSNITTKTCILTNLCFVIEFAFVALHDSCSPKRNKRVCCDVRWTYVLQTSENSADKIVIYGHHVRGGFTTLVRGPEVNHH